MHISGITFVGTRTAARQQMADFVRDVLGLEPDDIDASLFELPDGTSFAVVATSGVEPPERTVGFKVGDIEEAAQHLRSAGVFTDEISATDRHRYVHFRAPDGHLYELVEALS